MVKRQIQTAQMISLAQFLWRVSLVPHSQLLQMDLKKHNRGHIHPLIQYV